MGHDQYLETFFLYKKKLMCMMFCLNLCVPLVYLVLMESEEGIGSLSLDMELQMVVSYYVGAGNQTQFLYKSNQYFKPLRHPPTLDCVCLQE